MRVLPRAFLAVSTARLFWGHSRVETSPRRSMRPSTSEPAAPTMAASAAGSTAGLPDQKTASGTGHLTRSRPQDSASSAAAPQWEPRKPWGGRRKPRRGMGGTSGARKRDLIEFWPVLGQPGVSTRKSRRSRRRSIPGGEQLVFLCMFLSL